MRTDAKKNITKVASSLVSDPIKTVRETASETGLGVATVHRAKQELEQNGTIDKTEQVIRIAERDLLAVERIQSLEEEHIEEYLDKAAQGEFMKAGDLEALNRIGERKQKRASLLLGDNTKPNGGELLSEEKREIIAKLLK